MTNRLVLKICFPKIPIISIHKKQEVDSLNIYSDKFRIPGPGVVLMLHRL